MHATFQMCMQQMCSLLHLYDHVSLCISAAQEVLQHCVIVWLMCLLPLAVLPGSSPPSHYIARQRLHKSFSKHQRAQLRASAVIAWLHEHAAAAAGVTHLAIDLTHHSVHDFNRHQLELMLAALPRLQTLHMIGAVDGTDSYEPLSKQQLSS